MVWAWSGHQPQGYLDQQAVRWYSRWVGHTLLRRALVRRPRCVTLLDGFGECGSSLVKQQAGAPLSLLYVKVAIFSQNWCL